MESYLAAMRSYTTFEGRTSRRDYWMYTLCFTGLMFAAVILEGILGLGSNDFHPLMGVVSIAHLAPNLAISARRLHDRDLTAWWLLLWITGVGTIVTFIFSLLPGTPGSNSFGPPTISSRQSGPPETLPTGAPAIRGHAAQSTLTEELERLAQLRTNGSLTDDEFNAMKSRVMSSSR